MNQTTDPQPSDTGKLSWIAIGFIGAFALSVATIIYTGLNVQRHGAAFDGGFRSVTMAVGEVRTIDLVFESQEELDDVVLEISIPPMLELAGPLNERQAERQVSLDIGSNRFSIDVAATSAGKDYLRTRVLGDLPIDVYRVFVTVEEE